MKVWPGFGWFLENLSTIGTCPLFEMSSIERFNCKISITYIVSSHTICESSAIRFKYLPFSHMHVIEFSEQESPANNTSDKKSNFRQQQTQGKQPKNQLFSNNTCNSNNDNKTTTGHTDNRLSKIPTDINNVSPKHEGFKREIVTQQFKAL